MGLSSRTDSSWRYGICVRDDHFLFIVGQSWGCFITLRDWLHHWWLWSWISKGKPLHAQVYSHPWWGVDDLLLKWDRCHDANVFWNKASKVSHGLWLMSIYSQGVGWIPCLFGFELRACLFAVVQVFSYFSSWHPKKNWILPLLPRWLWCVKLVKHYRVTNIVVGHFWNRSFNRISWLKALSIMNWSPFKINNGQILLQNIWSWNTWRHLYPASWWFKFFIWLLFYREIF